MLLIDVDVFRRMPPPWFKDMFSDDGCELLGGQDIWFCLKALGTGIKTYCNWYAFAGHRKFITLEIDELPKGNASDWDNDVVALSQPAMDMLGDCLEVDHPKSVLEIGPGRSSYEIYDYQPDIYDVLIDDSHYVREWIEQAQDRGHDCSNVHLADHPSELFKAFEPRSKRYDLIVVDGPWNSLLRVTDNMVDGLREVSDEHTIFIMDDTQRPSERQLLEIFKGGRKCETVEHEGRETAILRPV